MRGVVIGGAALVLAALWCLALFSCDGKKEAPKAERSELADLAAQAETWAGRAETLTQRPWATRLEFPKRLHLRIQALRSFVQEAARAVSEPGAPQERLTERGRALITQGRPFDAALTLLERLANQLDQITGYARLIELHMPPLETQGEAPFRIRLTNLNDQATLGFKHLDEALTRILDQAPDAQMHENIATSNLRQVLETSAKLSEEVKKSSALASGAVDRQRLLNARIEWADGIKGKLGADLPEEKAKALDDARAYAKGLPAENAEVLQKLRNAQPDAIERAEDLGRRTDVFIEQVTRAFLDLGRKAGVPDPK